MVTNGGILEKWTEMEKKQDIGKYFIPSFTSSFFYKKTVFKNIQAEIPEKKTSVRTSQLQIMARKKFFVHILVKIGYFYYKI